MSIILRRNSLVGVQGASRGTAQGRVPLPPQNPAQCLDGTVEQAFDLVFVPRFKLSKRSTAIMRRGLWLWEAVMNRPPLKEITSDLALEFVDKLQQHGYATGTIEQHWWAVRRVVSHFYPKTNARRHSLGLLSGQPPQVKIKAVCSSPALRGKGSPLDLRLYDAWWQYHRPELETDCALSTIQEYETTLRQWEAYTTNPTLRQISNGTLDEFKARLMKEGLAAATVNKRLRHLKAILRRLGPQETRNPAGLGILYRIPYTKTLRGPTRLPRVIPLAQLKQLHDACEAATWPPQSKSGVSPGTLWRAVVVIGFNLGLSKEDLFGLRHDEVDLNENLITLVRGKTHRVLRLPINQAVRQTLNELWRPSFGDLLLYETRSNRQVYVQWHKIQIEAGVASEGQSEFYGFHDLRRTCATEFESLSAGSGTFILGHSTPAVTWRHYRNPSVATKQAADDLPQPHLERGGAAPCVE